MDARPSPVGDPITALRLQLLGAGYEPIPVVGPNALGNSPGKRPALKEWQSVRLDLDMVRDWRSSSLRGCINTGLRTGQLVGIDIDVLLAPLARDLQDLATRLFGRTPLRRIGQAPKLLLCYRTVEVSAKATTPEFRLPDGSKAQVESLAKGQQFVAYGVHPVTRSDYEWPEAGPDVVPLADLPVITPADAQAFLAAAEAVIRTAGGVHAKEATVEQRALPEQVSRPSSEPAGKTRSGGDFFRNVNAAALADIRCWFLRLFPKGYWQENASRPPGAWRVHSADLGRALEEDISVHETEGGHDFGTRQSRTPIDLVMEHGGAPAPKDAAFLLCEWLQTTPQSLGWQQEPGSEETIRGDGVQKPSSSPHSEPWPEPVDFLADSDLTGVPGLRPEHLPEALYRFVVDTAERMGVDPVSVALSAVVACSSVAQDAWSIQPKVHDHTWTENPRLWGAIVGDPSILKTPVIRACTRPIDALDARVRDEHAEATRAHKAAVDAWKAQGSDPSTEPRTPRLTRYMVEGTTTEALSEVLRDDPEARQRAAAGKVLVRQDEMGEFFTNLDRYRGGGKGGGDRGAYLRLYNGGRYVLDRVGRGSFACSNWSACFPGGIQPGPIQRIAREADDDGLLQRFLYCVPGQQTAGEDRVPDAAALARYEALFPALAALHPAASFGQAARAVVLRGGAHSHREALNRMCRALAAMPDTSARLKAALGKWPGLFARITLLFHLIEVADAHARGLEPPLLTMVSESVARRAASFLRDIMLPHLLRADALMFSTAQTGHARWIAGFILAQGGERVTQRDVVQAYSALRAPEARRELLDVTESLVTVGWLQPEPQASPSRPPTAWAVNPAVHATFAVRAAHERHVRAMTRLQVREDVARSRRKGR